MKKHVLGLLLSGSLMALTSTAYAEGFYAGANVGYFNVDDFANGGQAIDDSGKSYQLFTGYQFNNYFSLEGFYADFDKISATLNSSESFSIDTDSYGLSAIGSLPLTNDFSVFAKIGYQHWTAKSTSSTESWNYKETDNDLVYGLGANYQVTQQVSVRATWDRFDYDTKNLGDVSADIFSIGAAYSF